MFSPTKTIPAHKFIQITDPPDYYRSYHVFWRSVINFMICTIKPMKCNQSIGYQWSVDGPRAYTIWMPHILKEKLAHNIDVTFLVTNCVQENWNYNCIFYYFLLHLHGAGVETLYSPWNIRPDLSFIGNEILFDGVTTRGTMASEDHHTPVAPFTNMV